MTRRPRRASTRLAVLAGLVGATAVGCAETTYDESLASTTTSATDEVTVAPSTTLPSGDATALLPLLATDAATVPTVMVAEGDARPLVERIGSLWASVRQEVARDRPELLGDFDANVERIGRAVEFKRAADADKAATNLSALVDAFLA
jgi:hypothetical protein